MIYPSYHSKHNANAAQSSQEEESSCSQCKRNTYGIRQESQEDESLLQVPKTNNITESSSEDDASVPFTKNIMERNYQFEEMLKILQQQVDTLKRQNQSKDLMIRQLKFQMHKSLVEEERKMQSKKQAYEINRLRQELGCSPRNNLWTEGSTFKSASFQKMSDLCQGYERNHYQGGLGHDAAQGNYTNQGMNVGSQFMQTIKPKSSQLAREQQKAQYELKITILEKQMRECQLELLQQRQRLSQLEEQTKWQQKFIQSFIKMCEQLSLSYGQRLKQSKIGEDLKKKTKICWHYVKNLIGFFIQKHSLEQQSDLNT